MDAQTELPDDPALLKQMLVEREAVIAQRDTIISQRESQLEQIKREAAEQLEALKQKHQAELAAILRRFYGPRNERFDPTQLLLFGERVDQMPVDEKSIAQEAGEPLVTRRPRNRHKHGRGKLPEHLPRVRIEHDLPDHEKPCPCCGNARHKIGEETSEQLEYIPATFKVLQHVRFKYACRHCETHGTRTPIDIADKPAQPIEKSLAGPGLLAYIITSKLGDHLPLYRLERIFARSGVDIARSTMCAWLDAAAQLVTPLIELMAQRVRQSKVIHTDETRVPIQVPPGAPGAGEGKCRSGRIWTYSGDHANPYVVYDYTPDRTRAGPSKWLATYKGYLQADAYGGYDGIYIKGDVIEVACWAHARRKFFEAKETDSRRAAEMLSMVRDLYAVEDEAKEKIAALAPGAKDRGSAGVTHEEADALRRDLRQQRSVPVLARIKTWLDTESQLVLPRSPMAAAITYTLNQWDALNRYVQRGFLNIDNNTAERALKRVAIGRKNWLFAGNDHFGSVAATLYSLIASAERHSLDPQRYLTSILARIADMPVSQLSSLLPDEWKRRDTAPADAAANPLK